MNMISRKVAKLKQNIDFFLALKGDNYATLAKRVLKGRNIVQSTLKKMGLKILITDMFHLFTVSVVYSIGIIMHHLFLKLITLTKFIVFWTNIKTKIVRQL